ncbi:hypothetical protein LRAMOSA01026 [Lichtheimia ramosa]|uniref:HRDC domain-containing protein n=1 Tax=Lichtheimia ramosa TaxID=688394 RepID=A0A077WAM5_9FUNG|nr:hypothetical protein LRAMOSA01026 [Lichtheimia ramosa]
MASTSVPDPKSQFKEYQESLFKSLVAATNAANALPSDDLGFYRSLDRQFAKDLDTCGSRLLTVANNVVQHCSGDTGAEFTSVDDVDDATFRFNNVIDVVDGLLEKADMYLDEMRGRTRKVENEHKQDAPEVTQVSAKGKLEYKLLHANNIARPQLQFKDRVDNSNKTPFIRKIKVKPHAKVPLDYGVTPDMLSDEAPRSLPHPYEYEIEHLEYPDFMFEDKEPIMYEPFDTTSAIWVDNDEQLEEMMKDLATAREIAIDLEHHNYRSYQGFTCLMQISTRDQDYIVDTLVLRDRLWQLNEHFANPNIVKVLHGAESDINWLQRDFGLYIVNMFDTYFATKLLEFPQHSLAFLLKKYCSVDADKKYQLADWRIRPLPEEMLKYARSDTHYLLYIYDRVRNELIGRSVANYNLLRAALQRSNALAATKYEKIVYDAETGSGPFGWKGLLIKWKHPMTEQQLAVYKAIHQWRDVIARQEDESTNYVLPNHMLFALVERMPTESASVIGCCNPCPPLVRMNAQAIGLLVQRAKMDVLFGNTTASSSPTQTNSDDAATNSPVKSVNKTKTKKPLERNLDPSVFDVVKVQEARMQEASQLSKSTSSLFGVASIMDVDEDEQDRAIAERIRSTLKLTLPFEGLKVKVATPTPGAVKQEPVEEKPKAPAVETPVTESPSTSVKKEEEMLYVPSEERNTKKRSAPSEGEPIVLRESMRKKKKNKNKKKNNNPQQQQQQ